MTVGGMGFIPERLLMMMMLLLLLLSVVVVVVVVVSLTQHSEPVCGGGR